MLQPASGSVTFGEQFTITISVVTESSTPDPLTGEPVISTVPSTTVPVVTASYNDPGVTITPGPGQVTIAGRYTSIIPITWHFLNNNKQEVTAPTAPAAGSFYKITQVDSPPKLTETCTYTIDSESFVHTVTLGSYTTIANQLKGLLAGSN